MAFYFSSEMGKCISLETFGFSAFYPDIAI
jgi:hypothetical protein